MFVLNFYVCYNLDCDVMNYYKNIQNLIEKDIVLKKKID